MQCTKLRPFSTDHRLSLLLGALAVAYLTSACRPAPAPEPAPVSPDTWAVVDGRPITRGDVDKAFSRVGNGAPQSDEEALTAKLGVLEDLIVQDLLLAKARTLKVEVPDSEVDTAYTAAKQNMTDEAFQQELTRRGLTADDMRDGLRRQLISQKLLQQEVGAKVVVTDQQVTDFFNANREQFNLPEDAYHLAQIVVTPARDTQVANRTGDDAGTPQAAATKVAMVMARLKEGASFADLARDYSEDPETAARGGDLGLVPLSAVKQAPAPLRDAVLQMSPGSARAVNLGAAHTIVFVVAREAAGQRDLSMPEVRQRITDTLRGRKEQLLRSAFLAATRNDAEVVNYLARTVVSSQGVPPGTAPAPAK